MSIYNLGTDINDESKILDGESEENNRKKYPFYTPKSVDESSPVSIHNLFGLYTTKDNENGSTFIELLGDKSFISKGTGKSIYEEIMDENGKYLHTFFTHESGVTGIIVMSYKTKGGFDAKDFREDEILAVEEETQLAVDEAAWKGGEESGIKGAISRVENCHDVMDKDGNYLYVSAGGGIIIQGGYANEKDRKQKMRDRIRPRRRTFTPSDGGR